MSEELCVQSVPIFSGLSYADQLEVAASARPVSVSAGEPIYLQGNRPAPMIVLHRGTVKLERLTPDGKRRVVSVLEPGDFAGETALFAPVSADHSAVAVTDATVCRFTREAFVGLVSRHPRVTLGMLATTTRRLSESQDLMDSFGREVSARLAEYLLGLPTVTSTNAPLRSTSDEDWSASGASRPASAGHESSHRLASNEGLRVRLPMPKKDVASLLATTPESLSRALSKLVEQDLIQLAGPREIVLLDVEALTDLAGI